MKILNWLVTGFVLQMSLLALASDVGDAYLKMSQRINQTSLTSEQTQNLYGKLQEIESILNGGSGHQGFICVQGTVYGPNNQKIWTGDSGACEDPNKVYFRGDFACVTGTLYGFKGQIKWTGDSLACGNRKIVKIGTHYACASGYIYGPDGFEKWTGDSNYCEKAQLD